MLRATYQKRLGAIILGIRPSVGHLYGGARRAPIDNLTMVGIQAWQFGLDQLLADLLAVSEPTAGDCWIQEWLEQELERERHRWSDASTMLEHLAVALGPTGPDPIDGPLGRVFWKQWDQNLEHLSMMLRSGAASRTHDTADYLQHCLHLVQQHDGPDTTVAALADVAREAGPVNRSPAPFRPLTSIVERLQLSAILAAAYDDAPSCTGTLARLLEQRAPSPSCQPDTTARHRHRPWRNNAKVRR